MMVVGRITKQQRRDERKPLGRLSDLVVKPGTLAKYHLHFNKFVDWAKANEFHLVDSAAIDGAASQFIEALWADGFGRAEASYLMASIQFMLPQIKHEFPTRAVPLDAPTTLAFAGLFWEWQEYQLAAGILVAFDFFLRTGELFLLRRDHVEFFSNKASLQ